MLCIPPTFRLGLSKDMHDLYVGRILAQSPNQVSTLGVSDFHFIGWCPVKQLESIFEICEQKENQLIPFDFYSVQCDRKVQKKSLRKGLEEAAK